MAQNLPTRCVPCFLDFLLFFAFQNPCFALDTSEQKKISGIIHQYVDGWNEGSGDKFGENFSSDADFINIFGSHFHGKEEIQKRHCEVLTTFLKGSTFTITNLEYRSINPSLVMAFVEWEVDGFHKPGSPVDAPGEMIKGIFSHVFLKGDGAWQITATQNTLAR